MGTTAKCTGNMEFNILPLSGLLVEMEIVEGEKWWMMARGSGREEQTRVRWVYRVVISRLTCDNIFLLVGIVACNDRC